MKLSENRVGEDLPEHLAERIRLVAAGNSVTDGEFVLYWMHHAVRAHENPALDVAISLSNRLRLPLLVYQAIPERYPFASDRHHRFILEGVCDLQRQFQERVIDYAFYLERNGYRGPQLPQLCRRANVVVTEEMPVQPIRGWIEKLRSTTNATVLAVDTACVAPMRIVGKAFDRAFQFRQATEPLYRERVDRNWPAIELENRYPCIDLPFERLGLSPGNLASLISECDIDHSIGPVPHTPGGSAAGYTRWDEFKLHGLKTYAQRRNDPLVDGTSRLSPYLHYGMVSPLRIAREAAAWQTAGADKFLDELLNWRELAYGFCFFNEDLDSVSAIPNWARKTLTDRESDPRPAIYSWETLARGRTGDKLWDAAQMSLLKQGELHNNVRMTWGKALLQWTPDAETALAMIIDLNHRYALDGRDPASYGGILWCLGQFDRPFKPPQPIFGTVRSRTTQQHAKRLDAEFYCQRTIRPLTQKTARVAVLGAGISGLMCARTLRDHGIETTIFEKSRGVGGRMATRRTPEGLRFDHGAQYFTVRDERFQRYVDSWTLDGTVGPWNGRVCKLTNGAVQWKQIDTPRFVGIPGMSAVCRHLSKELNVQLNTSLRPPEWRNGVWHLADVKGREFGCFDYFVTSAPAPQSAEFLTAARELRQVAEAAEMSGCWAVMIGLKAPLDLPFDAAFVDNSPLSWIARNDSKPGRNNEGECWVLHASTQWTANYLEAEPDDVARQLVEAFWQSTAAVPSSPTQLVTHCWRYALPPEPLKQPSLFDTDLRVGACGDWCGGPRVEGAFLSGMSLAGRMLAHVLDQST